MCESVLKISFYFDSTIGDATLKDLTVIVVCPNGDPSTGPRHGQKRKKPCLHYCMQGFELDHIGTAGFEPATP
jgi:hypothetical protein